MTASRLSRLGTLSLLAIVSACSTTVARAPAGSAAPAEETADAAAPPSIRFVASYPATLLWALDGAVGARNHDVGYRAWLVGKEDPKWLADYATKRDGWSRKMHSDAGGGAPAFDVCGWNAQTVDEVKTCLDKVVPSGDRAILKTAIDEADKLLAPKWPALEAHFATLMPELDAALATDTAAKLFQTLRREASLPDATPLDFKVVLVGKPKSDHSFARQAGEHLVHEVDVETASGNLLAVAFHEIAHLAHHLSPERAAFEQSFMPLGDSGRLAANVWDEVVATAFGNGLAAEAFDPEFRVDRSFYADAAIDPLGRALYSKWKAGLDVRLGAPLAKELADLADEHLPAGARSVERYLWYVNITAEERSSLDNALDGIRVRSAYRTSPIDDTMAAPPGLPVWSARVVLATPEDLTAHPALVARVEMPEASWTSTLAGREFAVFRRNDPDGTMLFVVVAKDSESLAKALPAFARRPAMVPAGWTSW